MSLLSSLWSALRGGSYFLAQKYVLLYYKGVKSSKNGIRVEVTHLGWAALMLHLGRLGMHFHLE